MSAPEPLRSAIEAIQNGDQATGQRLLAQVLQSDPRNVQAWLWLSSVVEGDERRRDCLRRALAIDPQNEAARAGLAQLAATATRNPSLRLLKIRVSEAGPAAGRPPLLPASYSLLPDEEPGRRHGYRNLMLAGGMTLSMLCGIILLIATVTTAIPRARERLRPTPEAALYTATLWCPPCAQAGSPVVLWERVGDGVSRGAKVGELPHDTAVSVLAEAWSTAEGRAYYKVAAQGQKGWVPATFIKEP